MTQLQEQIRRSCVCAVLMLFFGLRSAFGAFGAVRDARISQLEKFFNSYGCPTPHYSADYVRAADAHSLDYRLLPAISLVESTCGVHERANNRWGWNSGKKAFVSIPSGIYFITSQLAHGIYYKGKKTPAKLLMYNPFPEYSAKVQRLMRQIGPEEGTLPVEDLAIAR